MALSIVEAEEAARRAEDPEAWQRQEQEALRRLLNPAERPGVLAVIDEHAPDETPDGEAEQ